MPKSDLQLAGGDYALVADRITLFYERHPEGRIITELVSRTAEEVIFRAAVYRSPGETDPAATGWASEREGDGDVNTVACLENTETSAIGRALANLGFTASARRPSAEEMAKAARARARRMRVGEHVPVRPAPPAVRGAASAPDAPDAPDARLRDDVAALLREAEREGLRPARAESAHRRLADPRVTRAELETVERGLRDWLARRAPAPVGDAPPARDVAS